MVKIIELVIILLFLKYRVDANVLDVMNFVIEIMVEITKLDGRVGEQRAKCFIFCPSRTLHSCTTLKAMGKISESAC